MPGIISPVSKEKVFLKCLHVIFYNFCITLYCFIEDEYMALKVILLDVGDES